MMEGQSRVRTTLLVAPVGMLTLLSAGVASGSLAASDAAGLVDPETGIWSLRCGAGRAHASSYGLPADTHSRLTRTATGPTPGALSAIRWVRRCVDSRVVIDRRTGRSSIWHSDTQTSSIWVLDCAGAPGPEPCDGLPSRSDASRLGTKCRDISTNN